MKNLILFFVSALLLSGCGMESQSLNSAAKGSNGNNNGGDYNTTPPKEDIIYEGLVEKNTFFKSGRVIYYNNQEGTIEVSIPFPVSVFLPEITGRIPDVPDVEFRISPNNGALTLIIPIEKYIELTKNPSTLPDGRPLPGIASGEPPSFGFPLTALGSNAYGYANFDSFSLFVEVDVNDNFPIIKMTFPIRDAQGTNLGTLYWLGPTGQYTSGVFLTVPLPKELANLLASFE